MKRLSKHFRLISILLVIFGLFMCTQLGLTWLERNQIANAQSTPFTPLIRPRTVGPNIIEGTPRHIVVPSLGIDAVVSDGFYDETTKEWTLSEESAFFATISNPANSYGGNTFIYGHNSYQIFGKLIDITSGATAIVTTNNGYEFTYKYASSEAVAPTDTIVLSYSGDKPRLTLQTCSGFWHQTRQMVYFYLESFRKI
jgi:LPXTG-site transpeptidase (sortase) family protein